MVEFCDASDRAYAAIVYLRTFDRNHGIESYFVAPKTKVAPKNEFKLMIPKLELQAAELLSRLSEKVSGILKVNSVFALSDSTIVLAWLKEDINRWSVFVQNRLRKIGKIIPSDRWSYVNTKQNPADLATRGIKVRDLINNRLWFYGPDFLSTKVDFQVMSNSDSVLSRDLPEQRGLTLAVSVKCNPLIDAISKQSNFCRLVNTFEFVVWFIRNCFPRMISRKPTINDLLNGTNVRQASLSCIIRIVQFQFYEREILAIRGSKSLTKGSSLYNLDPFVDKTGILRNFSRSQNASLSYEYRNLIILPAKCHFVEIFVKYLHMRYYHASAMFVVNFVRSSYLVQGGLMNVIKRVVHNCVTCKTLFRKNVSTENGAITACSSSNRPPIQQN